MRRTIVTFCTLLALAMISGCSSDKSPAAPAPTGTNSFAVNSGWNCAISVDCQDVYEFTFTAGSSVTITVSAVTGSSVLRLALFGPGVPLSGANLMLGSTNDRQCGGQDVADMVVVPIATTGVYKLAVGRDWGTSAGANGTYSLSVTSPTKFTVGTQTSDDTPSQAAGVACPTMNYQVASGWTCAISVDCQDVHDFDFPAGASVTINITNVTGASVTRLALFGPGDTLAGTNLLNSSSNDRQCVGQDANDSAAVIASAGGVYRLAVGRDWGSSAGASGNYTLTVTADMMFVPLGQTSNNTASQAAGTQCP